MKRVRYSWIVPQWLSSSTLTSTSTASRRGRIAVGSAPTSPVERVAQAVGRVGRDDERALAELRRADRGGRRQAGLADAALARVEDEPRLHRDAPAARAPASGVPREDELARTSARPRRSWTSCSSSGTSTGRSRVSTSSRAIARRSTRASTCCSRSVVRRGARASSGSTTARPPRRRALASGVGVHAVHEEADERHAFLREAPVEVERFLERLRLRARHQHEAGARPRAAARAPRPRAP